MNELNVNQQLHEGLVDGSAIDFQTAFAVKLGAIFERKMAQLKEQDADRNVALEVSVAAKSFGGEPTGAVNGVIAVDFRNRQGALHYADWLEEQPTVDYYEITASYRDAVTSQKQDVSDINLDDITDDAPYDFTVIVYLYPEFTQFTHDYDQDGDEDAGDEAMEIEAESALAQYDIEDLEALTEEQLDEVMRKIRVNARGLKSIKMQCPHGFKWDPSLGACMKITGQELSTMRKASRRAIITKKNEGQALKVRVKRHIRRAFKFRQMMGLGI